MDEAEQWMAKAEKDLADAEFNLDIHDLIALGNKVGAKADIMKSCDSLNPHYIHYITPVFNFFDYGVCYRMQPELSFINRINLSPTWRKDAFYQDRGVQSNITHYSGFFLCLLITPLSFASAPQALNIQGRLRDNANNIVADGNYALKVKI